MALRERERRKKTPPSESKGGEDVPAIDREPREVIGNGADVPEREGREAWIRGQLDGEPASHSRFSRLPRTPATSEKNVKTLSSLAKTSEKRHLQIKNSGADAVVTAGGGGAGAGPVDELAGVEYANLTGMEKDVLRIAKDSLKKKKYPAEIGFEPYTPLVEKLVNDCIARFRAQKGYTREQIIETIRGLERKRWIVTAERRTREEILGSGIHREILKLIKDYPGIHARDNRVQSVLNITRNPFLKHLLVLERFALIKKRKYGKMWNYFLPEFSAPGDMERLIVLLYNGIARQIVPILLENPGYTLMEIASRIIPPVFHGSVQYHMKKFEEVGFISNRDGKRFVNASMLEEYNSLVCDEMRIR
ncbi:MAG: hypothetical protein ACTSU9_08440 [Promethearchaeota archaeon]